VIASSIPSTSRLPYHPGKICYHKCMGITPAGTAGSGSCAASNLENIVIFPAAPPAPTVDPGCGPFYSDSSGIRDRIYY
jgi:hypothetical protein